MRPFRAEANDGFDTVEWAAAQPWCAGKVGMLGASYVGANQLHAAAARPPHLAAIAPWITAADYHEGWTYQGGGLMQWFVSSWTTGLMIDTLQKKTSARSQRWRPRRSSRRPAYPRVQRAHCAAPPRASHS